MQRAVHYVSAGSKFRFGCFRDEMLAHLACFDRTTWKRQPDVTPVPAPLRSTNIDQVTCRNCLLRLRTYVSEMLAGGRRLVG